MPPVTRTPRRRKTFATGTLDSNAVSARLNFDLLSTWKSDTTTNDMRGYTIMRVFGQVVIVEKSAASTPAVGTFALGFVVQALANLPVGEPTAPGIRETNWLQTARLYAEESASVIIDRGATAFPPENNTWNFDFEVGRKLNSAETLFLVLDPTFGQTLESGKLGIVGWATVMLAMP